MATATITTFSAPTSSIAASAPNAISAGTSEVRERPRRSAYALSSGTIPTQITTTFMNIEGLSIAIVPAERMRNRGMCVVPANNSRTPVNPKAPRA